MYLIHITGACQDGKERKDKNGSSSKPSHPAPSHGKDGDEPSPKRQRRKV